MKFNYYIFVVGILALGSLACGTFGGSEPEAPPPTVTTVSTPTLAPTVAATITQAGIDPAGSDVPTLVPTLEGGSSSEATPDQGGTSDGGGSGDGDGDGGSITPAACPASGPNLLVNPSFEGQYVPYGAFKELNHAPPWIPWWRDGENNQRPEFKPAEVSTAANRIHSGSSAQQYFKSHGMFKAGLYQSVLSVPTGSRLQFSAHGQAWSCEEFNQCPDGSSVNPSNMFMRVGIDPSGGTDPFGNSIIWSAYFNPLDQWQLSCVEAIAESDIVTVYLWASPDGPRQNQDVYWDDASLILLP
jgi:hypothetical protein